MSEESNTEIRIYKKKELISQYLINKWTELAKNAINDHGLFVVAISGGSTPLEFYKQLSTNKDFSDWDKVCFFIVDERFVPPGNQDHNYTNIKKYLFDNIEGDVPIVFSVDTSLKSAELAAQEYNNQLVEFFKQNKKIKNFDLILLGIGEDGHTASLFPGTDALLETEKFVATSKPKKAAYERITLTYPVINNARIIIFIATGEKKSTIIKDIIMNENSDLPASKVEAQNGMLFFLLDSLAASALSM